MNFSDVVTAYKGLLKEKEALEASLAALTSNKAKSDETPQVSTADKTNTAPSQDAASSGELQLQIATLMNSLATLSAEKSRMESSFQADKKQLRAEIAQKDAANKELLERTNELRRQHQIEIEGMKSKIIVERHEREKESNNHMVMIRELQKLYADERHLKENLEMQLNDLKSQFSSTGYADTKVKDLQKELHEAKEKLKKYENKKMSPAPENSNILQQLQNEMQHLKQQHAIAIKSEQKRALVAEERNKKLAALHEDRVANLEARLAELSSTVGTYDRLRQQDQENIQKLKDKIAQLATVTENDIPPTSSPKRGVADIVDEIQQLKKILLIENARSQNPIDINKIFNTDTDHSHCLEDYNKMQAELDAVKNENKDLANSVETQKNHIKTLQEKVKVLNRNIDDQEAELKAQADRIVHAVKSERSKWKESIEALENDYRGKLNSLEHQLQKQRSRSLQLLDEKENEIRALKTSFEIFIPQQQTSETVEPPSARKISASHLNAVLNSNTPATTTTASASTLSEGCHILHYVNELARKDVEISGLRKTKHAAETALRQALQDKVTAQEALNDKIMKLEQEVDR